MFLILVKAKTNILMMVTFLILISGKR
jgi:hypothetical protein